LDLLLLGNILLGAELTKVYAAHHGSQKAAVKLASENEAPSLTPISHPGGQLGLGSLVTGVLMVSVVIGAFRNKRSLI
jgi:hypothetical protein